jgi:DNA-binding MurR/RpiR family transcriptional regulator
MSGCASKSVERGLFLHARESLSALDSATLVFAHIGTFGTMRNSEGNSTMNVRKKAGPAIAVGLTEHLNSNMGSLTKAERRVARVLFANNMMPGLDTVAMVAAQAKVSGPTVLRFVTKQGFSGYPEFQRKLREEIGARVSSPLNLYQRGKSPRRADGRNALESNLETFSEGLRATFRSEQATEVAALTEMLVDTKRHVWLVGGRFSQMIAEILWAHVVQLRPKVHLVPQEIRRRQEALLDIRQNHFVLAFDFRRYQTDTIAFTSMAADRGAKVGLVTDRWLSPIAERADHIVTCDTEAPSPYDSLVSPLALVELLVGTATTASGTAGRKRMEELEEVRRLFDGALIETARRLTHGDS